MFYTSSVMSERHWIAANFFLSSSLADKCFCFSDFRPFLLDFGKASKSVSRPSKSSGSYSIKITCI